MPGAAPRPRRSGGRRRWGAGTGHPLTAGSPGARGRGVGGRAPRTAGRAPGRRGRSASASSTRASRTRPAGRPSPAAGP
ncbi:hypothetical protein F1544_20705 [Kineosporiaceae bacterium B12]|nr:hypothetical protein [Kineococcus rubinsiae]